MVKEYLHLPPFLLDFTFDVGFSRTRVRQLAKTNSPLVFLSKQTRRAQISSAQISNSMSGMTYLANLCPRTVLGNKI